MDIEFNCNKCGQHIVIDAAGVGETVQCPKCHRWLTVPSPDAVEQQAHPSEQTEASQTPTPKNIETTTICFPCPECNRRVTCAEKLAEKKVKCPHCKETITVPATATVKEILRREIRGGKVLGNRDGLETTLRALGRTILVVSILASVGAVAFCIGQETGAWLPLAVGVAFVGVVQFYLFRWAGEVLVALRKIAGIGESPKTYQYERMNVCAACDRTVTMKDTSCPDCGRALLWPEEKTDATDS